MAGRGRIECYSRAFCRIGGLLFELFEDFLVLLFDQRSQFYFEFAGVFRHGAEGAGGDVYAQFGTADWINDGSFGDVGFESSFSVAVRMGDVVTGGLFLS